jgi:hypothetical protein
MFTTTSTIALLLVASTSTAYAAGPTPTPVEPVVAAPVVMQSSSSFWEGAYVGAQIGYS